GVVDPERTRRTTNRPATGEVRGGGARGSAGARGPARRRHRHIPAAAVVVVPTTRTTRAIHDTQKRTVVGNVLGVVVLDGTRKVVTATVVVVRGDGAEVNPRHLLSTHPSNNCVSRFATELVITNPK